MRWERCYEVVISSSDAPRTSWGLEIAQREAREYVRLVLGLGDALQEDPVKNEIHASSCQEPGPTC